MRTLLGVVAWIEAMSLAVLLTNRATAHVDVITSSVGPIHGLAYLTVIGLAFTLPGLAGRTRLLGLIPVVGGLVLHRRISHQELNSADEPA
jgi:hypothetical protein